MGGVFGDGESLRDEFSKFGLVGSLGASAGVDDESEVNRKSSTLIEGLEGS